ncbi:MAG TPA: hypothetical protein VF174_15745 [Micromonosporaceae bacterium]
MALLEVFAEDRCPDCTELLRRVEALNSDLTYANATNARLSALNRQQDAQVTRLMEHLQHAVDERDALRVQVEAMTRDLIALAPMPRLTGPGGCARCKDTRKVDVGEDELGEVVIPCDSCCCSVCGDYTGGGLCDADREAAP